jgi:hypothetical protein
MNGVPPRHLLYPTRISGQVLSIDLALQIQLTTWFLN